MYSEGNIFVDVPRDEVTSKITENQKFVFGGIPPNIIQGQIYQVYAFKNFMNDEEVNERILSLELTRLNAEEIAGRDGGQGKDDLYNNIADVYKMKLYTLKINEEDITQSIGYTTQLHATVFKDNDKIVYPVLWESSNPSVISIDEDGNLEILDTGEATITCKLSSNNEVSDSIQVIGMNNPEVIEVYRFSPLGVDVILQGDSQVFSIYHYTNNEKDVETFRLKVSGVPNEDKYKDYFYRMDFETGDIDNCNEFEITNNQGFFKGNLNIEAFSNITNQSVGILSIRLGGII